MKADWRPSLTIKEVLLGLQELLTTENLKSPANDEAYMLYRTDKEAYRRRIKAIAAKNKLD